VPVDPDAEQARDWILRELTDPAYQAARPNWFDLLVKSIWDWINSLQFGDSNAPPFVGFLVVGALVAVILLVAFLIFGLPRFGRQSRVAGALFGEEDSRTAAVIRRAAEAAADRGDYTLAVAEMFRAIARGLGERTLVTTSPGTTARDFARRAGRVFAERQTALDDAARAFDAVRYLQQAGTVEQYRQVAELEAQLRAARPALEVPA
jgi:signal transduction histidine kinase